MQKKLIALAVAALASGAAFAQSNVTIYGRMDYGYVSRSGSDGGYSTSTGNRTEFASGVEAGSRLGFKGTEDLGNGWKALFEAEFGLAVDSGNTTTPSGGNNATWWNRHSYVGLTSATYGTFLGGRVDGARYSFVNKYDPFAGGTVANAITTFGGQVSRGDNAIAYVSPTFGGGFSVLAAYTDSLIGQEHGYVINGAVNQNTRDTQLWVLAGMYDNGPISLTLDFEGAEDKDISNSNVRVLTLGGSYDFGSVKISGLYDKVDTDTTTAGGGFLGLATGAGAKVDMRNWMLGATGSLGGNWVGRASYISHDDKTAANGDCKKLGIGVVYNLSKRTHFYGDLARITNNSTGACSIGFAGTAGAVDASTTAANGALYGTHGFDMGIAHTF